MTMRTISRRIAPALLAATLALGVTACDGDASDDLENIEENVEEGADEVGDAVEDGGDAIEEGTNEVGDDDGGETSTEE